MRDTAPPSPAVIVGIDGSRRAVSAALWAVAEAVDRDQPLRLVYAIEPREGGRTDSKTIAHDFAGAECAVRHAVTAVESTNQPVKIEVEIAQGHPVEVLLAASRAASMLCVGALGVNHATGKRLGSATTGLLARAHCPVAIVAGDAIRADDRRWVVAEVRERPDTAVLEHAVEEARLRNAPLRVLTSWRPTFADVYDRHATTLGNRQAKAHLDRSLTRYRLQHPDLDITAVAVPGSATNYLARHADDIQLVVVDRDQGPHATGAAGAATYAALANTTCSMLVSERHGAL